MSRMCLSTRFKYASINVKPHLTVVHKWGFDNIECEIPTPLGTQDAPVFPCLCYGI